jgi:hypothetical protein
MLKRVQRVEPSTWVWSVAVVATVIVASSVVGSVWAWRGYLSTTGSLG